MKSEPSAPHSRPRVVLLCRDDDPSKAVSNLLDDSFELLSVVVENNVSKTRLLKGRARKVGWFSVLGQVAFIAWARLTASTARGRIQEIYKRSDLRIDAFPEHVVARVESVNSPEVQQLLRDLDPQVVVVNGTRIISSSTLNCVEAPFVNTHAGITPRYRGVHGGYWAMARGDAANCGVTVHLVDEGIDTGNVLSQAVIEPTSEDSFHTYPALQLEAARELILKAVEELSRGDCQTRPGVGPSELFYHPTLWGYLWRRLTRGVR